MFDVCTLVSDYPRPATAARGLPADDWHGTTKCSGDLTSEDATAHHALGQAHGVVGKIAVGENHGKSLANPVLSYIAKLPLEPD